MVFLSGVGVRSITGVSTGRGAAGFERNAAPRKEMLGFGWELGV